MSNNSKKAKVREKKLKKGRIVLIVSITTMLIRKHAHKKNANTCYPAGIFFKSFEKSKKQFFYEKKKPMFLDNFFSRRSASRKKNCFFFWHKKRKQQKSICNQQNKTFLIKWQSFKAYKNLFMKKKALLASAFKNAIFFMFFFEWINGIEK